MLLLCDADEDLVLVLAEELLTVAGCFLSLVDLFTVLLLLLFSFLVGVDLRVLVSVLLRLVVVLLFTVPLLVVVLLLFTVPLFVSVLLLFTVPLLLVPVDCCVRLLLFTVALLRLF